MENKEVSSGAPRDMSHSLRREVDSLDDFEHLGHDISPLKEPGADLLPSPARDELGTTTTMINKGVESAEHGITDELSSFDPLKPSPVSLFDTKKKMDSNLLEMGDNFPDRKEGDDKLDKFLQEMGSFAPPKHQEAPEVRHKDLGLSDDGFKSATQNFMDLERESIQPKKIHSSNDQLERYSDSEPDNDDDFKPSKYEDFPKKVELPESFDNFKMSETFKDVDEQQSQFSDFSTKDDKFEPFKAPTPEPVIKEKEKTPEPIKKPVEKAPEPPATTVCKKPEAETKSKKTNVIDAEAIFCKMGLDAWFNPERLNPRVESLIYWRDPKKSGPVFGGVLLVLLALTYFSLISVVAYLSLFSLTATVSFRIYKNIVQAVQKTGDGHPFKDLLEFDISLPQEKVKEVSEIAVAHVNAAVVELRRLFLVEDLVDSIKFGVLLWTLTYLGAWFNGMTLIIIAWVALFTLPKVYETNKTQIDSNLEIVRSKLAEITSKVKAAIPIGKKPEEKKEQ